VIRVSRQSINQSINQWVSCRFGLINGHTPFGRNARAVLEKSRERKLGRSAGTTTGSTALVGVGGARQNLLLRESGQHAGGQSIERLQGRRRSEAPARAAVALVLDGRHDVGLAPIDGGWEVGQERLFGSRQRGLEGGAAIALAQVANVLAVAQRNALLLRGAVRELVDALLPREVLGVVLAHALESALKDTATHVLLIGIGVGAVEILHVLFERVVVELVPGGASRNQAHQGNGNENANSNSSSGASHCERASKGERLWVREGKQSND
jgi:hypothetical protein